MCTIKKTEATMIESFTEAVHQRVKTKFERKERELVAEAAEADDVFLEHLTH
jgi:hypothetical protein